MQKIKNKNTIKIPNVDLNLKKRFFSKHNLFNFVLLLVVIFLFIFFAEISVRLFTDVEVAKKNTGNLFQFFQKSDNPELGFDFIPNTEGYLSGKKVKINSQGLRDIDYPINKPKNTYRIAVIGDSITFGYGVDVNESYPEILEEILNSKSKINIEVLNFGVPGYTGIQEFYILENKVLKYDPDLIIIGHYLNDPDEIWDLFESASKIPTPIKTFLDERSYFYRWVQKKVNRIKNKAGVTKFTTYKKLYETDSDYWINHKLRFQEMSKISEEKGIPILVVLLPDWENLDDTYLYKDETKLLNTTIIESGLFSLDIFPEIKGLNSEEYKINQEDLAHPNYKGHKLIAEIIAKKLDDSILMLQNNESYLNIIYLFNLWQITNLS